MELLSTRSSVPSAARVGPFVAYLRRRRGRSSNGTRVTRGRRSVRKVSLAGELETADRDQRPLSGYSLCCGQKQSNLVRFSREESCPFRPRRERSMTRHPARGPLRPFGKATMGTRMAAFRIELLHHADDAWEPLLAERHEIHTPDLEATVVQARALFGALSPGRPSLVSFRKWRTV